jgi:4-aminobutyrate aminotransferase
MPAPGCNVPHMTKPDRSEGDINLTPGRAEWARTRIGTQTAALLARDEAVFLHQALSTPCLNVIERTEGPWLIDVEGRRYLDFHGNAVHQLGYGHPRVVAALQAQLATLPFCPRRYANVAAIELAERLAALAPFDGGRVLFAPGGTSAIGIALKLARVATGRHKTLSMWDSFHGASLDAISVGGEAIFRRGLGPLMPGTEHVPPPSLARRFFGDDERAPERLADYIDYVLATEGDIGAIIAEPMRWTTVEPPPPGFWPRVRESCDRYGTLLIFDEVPSFARTGTMFACEQTGAAPDILVLGKGLGGGVMPMAAVIARDGLNVAAGGALGHYTHEKSSLGCAAGLATLDVIRDDNLIARSVRLGSACLARLRAALHDEPRVRDVRGSGLYFGIELDDPGAADAVMYAALARGVSFKVGGGTVLTLCPPLTIEEDVLEGALDSVAACVRALQ